MLAQCSVPCACAGTSEPARASRGTRACLHTAVKSSIPTLVIGEPPLAQGGIQILGKAEASTMVADVSVFMQLLFQRSMLFLTVKVPQIQFTDRLCEHSVVPQRWVLTVQAVQKIVEFHDAG